MLQVASTPTNEQLWNELQNISNELKRVIKENIKLDKRLDETRDELKSTKSALEAMGAWTKRELESLKQDQEVIQFSILNYKSNKNT